MAWEGGNEINIPDVDTPRSLYGPGITQVWDTLFLAYIGEGGRKLYTCQCDASTGVFGGWSGNTQVVSTNGKHLETASRPTIWAPLFSPSIIYIDHDSGLLMQTDGSKSGWSEPVVVSDFGNVSDKWDLPLISTVGLKNVLFALDHQLKPWYSFQVFDWDWNSPNFLTYSPWTAARKFPRSPAEEEEQLGAIEWFATVSQDRRDRLLEIVYGVSRRAVYVYQSLLVYDPAQEFDWSYLGKIDLDNDFASMANTSPYPTIIYTQASGDLYAGTVDPFALMISPLGKLGTEREDFRTDSWPAALSYKSRMAPQTLEAICVAFKKDGAHELCFGFDNS